MINLAASFGEHLKFLEGNTRQINFQDKTSIEVSLIVFSLKR